MAWTGGNDIEIEGQYRWSYSNTTLTFFAWHPNEPSPTLQLAEAKDCIDLLREGNWNDRPCSYRNPFICEISKGQ
jgi:hypothetical protein